jgi:hypothetical protein
MWILILTVLMDVPHDGVAVSVDHVDGFGSYQACMSAGYAWGESTMKQAPPGTKMSARCVSKTGGLPPAGGKR